MNRLPQSAWMAAAATLLVAGLVVAGVAMAAKSSKRPNDDVRGRELYERHCQACHGANAAGDGPTGKILVGGVPDLRGKLGESDREDHVMTINDGKNRMPGYEMTFDKADGRRVMKFMEKASLSDPDQPAKPPAEGKPKTKAKDTGKGGEGQGD